MFSTIKKWARGRLLWSEQYLRTDMLYLAHGGFWVTFSQLAAACVNFLLAIAFARFVSPEIYGTYKYILSIAGLLSAFALTGVNTALIQSVARGFEGSVRRAPILKIRWGLIGLVGGIAVSAYYLVQGRFDLAVGIFIAALFVPLVDSFIVSKSLLTGRKLFKEATRYNLIVQFVASGCMLAVLPFTQNLLAIVLTYFASYTLVRIFVFRTVMRKFRPNDLEDPGTESFGKHLSLMSALVILSEQADRLLIWHYLGPSQLAIYSFALVPVNQLLGILGNIKKLALPKLSGIKARVVRAKLPSKLLRMYIIIVPVVILYVCLAPILYNVFLPQYAASVPYSRLYAIILLFMPSTLLYVALQSQAQKWALYASTIVSPIFRIIILFFLINAYGLWGLVIGTLASNLFSFALNSALFNRMENAVPT